MTTTIENSKIPNLLWREDYRNHTAEFTESLAEPFAWKGIPGRLFQVKAFLPSSAWTQEASDKFAHWRCAVFAPEKIDLSKPVAMAFTGGGGDYAQTGWIMKHIVEGIKGIFVAFDTHMTGERNLIANYHNFGDNLLKLDKLCNHKFNADTFVNMTQEISFNAGQVMEFVGQLYSLPHRNFVTTGFCFGGYLSSQIAFSHKNCLGISVGDASPYIGEFRVNMDDPLPRKKHIVLVKRINADAYFPDMAHEGQYYVFNFEEEDKICPPTEKIREVGNIIQAKGAKALLNILPGGSHALGPIKDAWLNPTPTILKKMIEGLYELMGDNKISH